MINLFELIEKNVSISSNPMVDSLIFIFVFLTYIFVKIAEFMSWLFSFKLWVYLILLFLIILIISILIIVRIKSNNSKKKIKTSTKKFYDISKIFILIFSLLITIFAFVINYCYFDKITKKIMFLREISAMFFINILPFIVTIISISLSMPKELIYGLEKTKFRKFYKASRYSFLQILFISLSTLVLYFIASSLNYLFVILVLLLISLIYCFYFIWQEIPLLMHSDKRINKVIKVNFWLETSNINLDIVLKNLLFDKGIIKTYEMLKKEGNSENFKILNKLLDLQCHYFWRVSEILNAEHKLNIIEYDNINIINAIDVAFENLRSIPPFEFNGKIDFKKTDVETYSHLILILINKLHEILSKNKMEKKEKTQFDYLLNRAFQLIDFEKNDLNKINLSYNVLNKLVIYSLSNYDLWLVEYMLEYVFITSSLYSSTLEYMTFIIIYLFYMIHMDRYCPEKFKHEIKDILHKKIPNTGFYGNTWIDLYNTLINNYDFTLEKKIELLSKLLLIYKSNDNILYVFSRKGNNFRYFSNELSFNSKFIMNWWICYILNSINKNDSYDSNIKIEINLDEEDKYILAEELLLNWFVDGELQNKKDIKYFEIFNMDFPDFENIKNSPVVKELFNFSNNLLKKDLLEKYEKNDESLEFDKYLNKIEEKINEKITSNIFFDKNISLENSIESYQKITIINYQVDKLFELYINEIPNKISKIIYHYIQECNLIKKVECNGDEKTYFDEIKKFQPEYMSFYQSYKRISNDIKEILNNTKQIMLPIDIFVKNKGIKINMTFDKNKSEIRYFNDDEINNMIENKYRMVNGLYRYSDDLYTKSSIMLTRTELFLKLKKRYLQANLVFKYKIELNYHEMLHLVK